VWISVILGAGWNFKVPSQWLRWEPMGWSTRWIHRLPFEDRGGVQGIQGLTLIQCSHCDRFMSAISQITFNAGWIKFSYPCLIYRLQESRGCSSWAPIQRRYQGWVPQRETSNRPFYVVDNRFSQSDFLSPPGCFSCAGSRWIRGGARRLDRYRFSENFLLLRPIRSLSSEFQ